jgi:cysteine desulfurase
MKSIYLDYSATTPVDERVVSAMLPYFTESYGNPSSVHSFGQKADAALEGFRADVADVLGCSPREIIFTSGGSESDNLALRGAALAAREKRGANRIFITPVEHHAVEKTAHDLADHFGFEVVYLPVDRTGMVIVEQMEELLDDRTAVVSAIYANNEIGTINPISAIGEICRQKQLTFHTDAVQAAGVCDLNVERLNVDLLSIGAHKFYGPKGVGALYIRKGTHLQPVQTGGAHENAQRAGTQNIPLIAGLAEALSICVEENPIHIPKYLRQRDMLINGVTGSIPGAQLTGHPVDRLPGHASFVIPGVDGNQLVIVLDRMGFACSSGSACKTGSPEPSNVLLALGINPELAMGSLRVTVGRQTTDQDISGFLSVLPAAVEKARRQV